MSTITSSLAAASAPIDRLSGTSRAHALDRWIYVAMAALFLVLTVLGFVPDALKKVADIQAGRRPPFPLVLHVHSVLMIAFLLLLLAQTVLVAMGRRRLHRTLGAVSLLLVPALVIVGFMLVPANYLQVWDRAQSGPPELRAQLAPLLAILENVTLLQIRIGVLFTLLITIGLLARSSDPGLHKRMMILGTAAAMSPATVRIPWLWNTLPASPVTDDFWPLMAVVPMLLWDVIRNGRVHRAYVIWMAIYLPAAVAVYLLWDTPAWHATARQLMGV